MFEPVAPQSAAQVLLFSGGLAILWSSLLGLFMMIPHLGNQALSSATRKVNFRQLLAAHLDWIMLAFVQGIAAGLLVAFEQPIEAWVVFALIFSGWMNAVPYFLRAFGINAFVYGGDLFQKSANILGGLSVAAMITAWTTLLFKTAPSLIGA